MPLNRNGGLRPDYQGGVKAHSRTPRQRRSALGVEPATGREFHSDGSSGGVRENLPTGTVTFLFTDVEGSTQAAAMSLGRRRTPRRWQSIAASFERHSAPTAASRWTRKGTPSSSRSRRRRARLRRRPQRLSALAAGPIRVRMGIHTGTPLVTERGLRRRQTSIGRHGLPPSATAARCSFRRRRPA